ncbi:XRE family transcriptional regulator [Nocardioides guangzhouensis]|uniref:XRE family transcriptional regulator n=1 Tax=Nocardioides guangzhouensis TaxID=2497878 RepID=A0A4V1XYB8_9ACTN|nr:helix-turn-helix transcriptional regulator [Nocardioides guangzhouensis]RYP82699.1 XRE family transcriptional regulator [Nocardioides guangzhouensis]
MGDTVDFPVHRTSRPTAGPAPTSPPPAGDPLWRELLGAHLREERVRRGERLADVAERAGISPQYLSEVERGLKDPSSEMLAAVAGAVGLTLGDLALRVARSVLGPVTVLGLAARPGPAGRPGGSSRAPGGPVQRGPLCLSA